MEYRRVSQMTLASLILWITSAYAVAGLLFAVAFVARGSAVIDPSARASPLGFRLLIFPGAAALWPVLLRKWIFA
jgi:hypothetical protein